MPRSPRTQAAAAALVLFDPTCADTGRAKKRSTVEVAEEEVRKVTLATTKLKKELDKLLAMGVPTAGRAATALQNKKTKFFKSRDETLPNAKAKLVTAKQKASDAKTLHEAKVAQEQKKKDMHGAYSDAFVCHLVELRASPRWQDKMDNTSDKNVDVWGHIAKELWGAIDGGEYDESNRRTAEAYTARWTVELCSYRQWCAVCQRAITQSGLDADDVLEKVQQHQRPST